MLSIIAKKTGKATFMYQKTHLTKKIRLAIMLSLFACFFIIAPLLILYTTGYRFDFSKKQFFQTGVISIDILPRDAEVYLNGVRINKKSPIRLPNYAPGNYTIKFSKTGYQDWQKEIVVESKKTTYLKNITLFKNDLPVLITQNEKNIKQAIFSSDGRYALLTIQENETETSTQIYEIVFWDLNNKTSNTILRVNSLSIPEINWSPYNNFAFIKNQEISTNFVINLFNPNSPNQLQTFNFSKINNWQWSKNSYQPQIYFDDGKTVKLLTTNLRELGLASSSLWYVTEDDKIWFFNNENEQLQQAENFKYSLKNTETIKKIIEINQEKIILQGDNNSFIIDRKTENKIYTLPTQNFYYNIATKEWLSWSLWELWTIYQETEPALLTRTSEGIEEVTPLDQYGVLLVRSENNLRAFNPGYYINHNLLTSAEIKKVTVNPNLRKIYFWGKVGQLQGIFELNY